MSNLPGFHRPVFSGLFEDLHRIPQILAITGPRRIGKSTLLYQIIRRLLADKVPPERIVYYSFDDPALISRQLKVDELIEQLMKLALKQGQTAPFYLLFDEIQRLNRWELYLKKYYDLKYPIKVVISGSASSPIFKKTQESLLGRVKDYHLLPFSFREYALYSFRDSPDLVAETSSIHRKGQELRGMAARDPTVRAEEISIPRPSSKLRSALDQLLNNYFLMGGFPEVWELPDWVSKQDYLYDNQVKKVIYEDLVLAAEFRKPELLKRFYISLLEMPGREVNVKSVASETEINAVQIEKYLPLLEMTDLVYRISKFRSGPLRVRKGMMKFYLVDLALRNAVLRLGESLLSDSKTLGLYAENLVFLALKKWRGTIQMDYYRERQAEVDFVIHVGPQSYLPVEVKYQNNITTADFSGIRKFADRFHIRLSPLMVTKRWQDFGYRQNVLLLPLPLFLLLFD